ncbi:ribosomal-protein-alanine N-acetyltransferase [Planctomycetes bacterium CA13]|uniref:Ribosomal-protein-alanine N-acetyltransferase n=1 Tax=Novipirellula herctigrandis TaxID=2527986 RepID=A0A5C5YV28_9BACT|nr:ribosomal-protein-alanine N-acetyltransferase [Planctomycetes bacterium CA13]
MMKKSVVRDFNRYCAGELYSLYRDVYSTSEGMSGTLEDKYRDRVSFEEDITILQSLPGGIALAAGTAQKPDAYLTIRPRTQSRLRHTADLNMGVAQSARGKGFGEQLLRAGLKRATTSQELEIVYLMVRTDNEPAIRLYQKMEFETLTILSRDIKTTDAYYDGILMRKFVD